MSMRDILKTTTPGKIVVVFFKIIFLRRLQEKKIIPPGKNR